MGSNVIAVQNAAVRTAFVFAVQLCVCTLHLWFQLTTQCWPEREFTTRLTVSTARRNQALDLRLLCSLIAQRRACPLLFVCRWLNAAAVCADYVEIMLSFKALQSCRS